MILQVLKNDTFLVEPLLPTRGTEKSTGYDIKAISEPEIVGVKDADKEYYSEYYSSIDYIQYRTGLFVSPKSSTSFTPFGNDVVEYDILLMPRSSISKYNLSLANSVGLIDTDYRNEILVRFNYIWQPEDYTVINGRIFGKPNLSKIYKRGDAVAQIKVTVVERVTFHLTDSLDSTTRTGGFGSTDSSAKETLLEKFNLKTQESAVSKRYLDNIKEREKQFI
jgi:dUTPase